MPFTVYCAACDSRFLLGDDLFRRKVSGKVVTVKCRSCNAEILVDATEPKTLPSQELPRRARPAPPRPKHKEGDAATATPMPGAATPLPSAATATPLPADALPSIWDAGESNVEPPRKAPLPRPHAPTFARAQAKQAEFIEDIEGPASSSDAPSLNTLRHEAHPPKKNPSKKAPDDFLVNLSTGTGGILGAPTIDVMGLAAAPTPEIEELLEVEATELTPRTGTIPLFDMSAVLPALNTAAKSVGPGLSPSEVDLSIDVEMAQKPSESGKPRTRKYVIAPNTPEDAPAPKSRRAGAAAWFVLVAAAAGVLIVVGLRARGGSHSAEPVSLEHPPALVENAPVSDLAPATPAPIPAAVAPAAAVPADTASATKRSSTATASVAATAATATGVKSAGGSKPAESDRPSAEAAPAIDKPAEGEKPAAPRPEPAEPGTEFDRSAAIAALKSAAAEASACRKDGDPSGTASLTITFAPSGRVTSANIQGPPFAGTPTGGCIANAMRHAHVPAFSGDRVTVNKTIVVQ